MAVYEFEGKSPAISESAYIDPSAAVIGDAEIGPHCFIGPGAVIRADFGRVCIGSGCAVEDNCVLHSDLDSSLVMGDNVIIGHGTIVHGPCIIQNNAIIGMGSLVASGCEMGLYSFLAAGSVLLQDQKIPDRKLAAGNPAIIKRPVDEKLLMYMEKAQELYGKISDRYIKGLRQITP